MPDAYRQSFADVTNLSSLVGVVGQIDLRSVVSDPTQ
jgi:hypothetical protein